MEKISYNIFDLKNIFRYEYKTTDGNYHTITLGDLLRINENFIFNIDFCSAYKTAVFCLCEIREGVQFFTIERIISIDFEGFGKTFLTYQEFISDVYKSSQIISIKKY